MRRNVNVKNHRNTFGKEAAFLAFSALLVLLIAFFVTGTVSGQSADKLAVDEKYYVAMEKEYVCEIREYLNEQGFENSGVTLTRVVEADGSREYEIALHHKYLEKLEDSERSRLFEEIEAMAFDATGCIFRTVMLACN